MTAILDFDSSVNLGPVHGESRRTARFPMPSTVRVCWLDESRKPRILPAQGLNLSAGGAAFFSTEELPAGTKIHLELPFSRLSALATVRNCEHDKARWRVGVEFEGKFFSIQ